MARRPTELKNMGYEIFIGALSILSIFNLVLAYAFVKDPALQEVIHVMNALFSGIFIVDFTYRIVTTSKKADYFFRRFGWADLLSSLPFPQFKILRIFRLLRVYRLMKDYGAKNVLQSLTKDRAGSALVTLLMAGILVLEFGSLAILRIEEYARGSNIKTATDALWYVIVTISTVGYGDHYPVTTRGYFVGTLIIVVGVGIFGTFTGYLANLFLSPAKEKEPDESDVTSGLARIEQIKRLMKEQLAEIDEIAEMLQEDAG